VEFLCGKIEILEMALSEQIESLAAYELDNWKTQQTLISQRYSQQKQRELDSHEQQLRVSYYKIEQQRIEIEKLKIQEKLNEQKIRAQEKERADRIREQELLLEQEKSRQQLQRSFQEQMAHFRAHGTLPTVAVTTTRSKNPKKKTRRGSKSKSATLETVSLEAGTSEDEKLEKFLEDSDNDKLDKFFIDR